MNSSKSKRLGIAAAASGGIMWGFSGSCGQYLFSKGISSNQLTSMRMLCSGAVLCIICLITQRKLFFSFLRDFKSMLLAAAFGVFGIITSQLSYMTAISYSNAATATALQYLGPVIIMGYTCFVGKRFPKKLEVLSVFMAVLGTVLLATHGNLTTLAISKNALLWGLISAVGFALYSLLPTKIIPKYGALCVSAVGMSIGGILLSVIFLPQEYSFSWNANSVLAFSAVVFVGTVAAYTLFLKGASLIGAERAGIISCVEPISAALISAVWLKTEFAFADALGLAAVVTAVVIISLRKN